MIVRCSEITPIWVGVDSSTPPGHCIIDGTDALGRRNITLYAADWLADEAGRRVDAARDSAALAAVADQLVWWRKARADDLDQIGRLSDERDELRAQLDAARAVLDTAGRTDHA